MRWTDTLNCSTPILPKVHLLDESLTLKKREEVTRLFGGIENVRKKRFWYKTGTVKANTSRTDIIVGKYNILSLEEWS